MKAIVTGGAGFIGSNLCRALAKAGHAVTAIDDLSTGKRENLAGSGVRLVKGSILNERLLKKEFKGAQYIFHLAAIASVQKALDDPALVSRVNTDGTLAVLMAAKDAGARRLVFASSAAVYGNLPGKKKETDRVMPLSLYAGTKIAGEQYARMFTRLHGLETVSLRFFNVYGDRQDPNGEYAAAIPRFASCLFKGKAPIIHGDGKQTRDFVHVDDVARACMLAAKSKVSGEAINIATGKSISINSVVELLITLTGSKRKARHTDPVPGAVRHSSADVSKAKRLLGWSAKSSFNDGIRKTMSYYEKTI